MTKVTFKATDKGTLVIDLLADTWISSRQAAALARYPVRTTQKPKAAALLLPDSAESLTPLKGGAPAAEDLCSRLRPPFAFRENALKSLPAVRPVEPASPQLAVRGRRPS